MEAFYICFTKKDFHSISNNNKNLHRIKIYFKNWPSKGSGCKEVPMNQITENNGFFIGEWVPVSASFSEAGPWSRYECVFH